jgi:hypothetical protein
MTAGLGPPLFFQRSAVAALHEYQVPLPKFHSTTSNEVGHVLTDTLDGI